MSAAVVERPALLYRLIIIIIIFITLASMPLFKTDIYMSQVCSVSVNILQLFSFLFLFVLLFNVGKYYHENSLNLL